MSYTRKHVPSAATAVGATIVAIALAGCTETTGPIIPSDAEYAVVLNSVERSLSVVPVDDAGAVFTVGLAPDGSPASLAVRGGVAVVPLGTLPSAAVVDLETLSVRHTVALPAGSGATGAAFLNDSIALVANTALNTVSPINVRSGARAAEIAVGTYPQAIIAANDTAFVLEARLDASFQPIGPGTISVLAGRPLQIVRTIELSGLNPGAAAFGRDGRIYVLHSGRFGAGDASLSVVDRATLHEIAHDGGFGEFPGALAVAPDGRIAVAAFAYGVALWNPATRTFARAPAAAVAPGGIPSASAAAFDEAGRLYTLQPDCLTAGTLFRLDASFAVDRERTVGICPLAIAFTRADVMP
jgi:hypothetical protein